MITKNITALVNYGIAAGLLDSADRVYTINRLLELFGIEEFSEEQPIEQITDPAAFDLEGLLKEMLDYAAEQGLLPDDSIVYRDLFDTKIMGTLVPRPSDVIYTFQKLYREKGAKRRQTGIIHLVKIRIISAVIVLHVTRNGRQKRNMERWTLQLIFPSRKKTQKQLLQRRMRNRADIPNASFAWKMKATQGV